ncbi:MAG: tetratricopeptide repeat protein [Promethearchaeota archaeon]
MSTNDQLQKIHSLIHEGKLEVALNNIQKALRTQLDPISVLKVNLSNPYYIELILAYTAIRRLQGLPDEAIQVINSLLDLKVQLNEIHEVKILEEKAMAYEEKGDLKRAHKIFKDIKTLPLITKSKNDWARIQRKTGRIHWQKGDLTHAEKHVREAIEVFQEQKEEEELAYALVLLANIILFTGKYKKALKTYNEALVILEKRKMKYYKSRIMNNIGEVYRERGETEKALKYYNKALTIDQEIGDKLGVAIAYLNIAHVYKLRGDLDQAHGYYSKAIETYPDVGESSVELFVEWGQIQAIREDFDHAEELLAQAKKVTEQRASDIDRALCYILEGFLHETAHQRLSRIDIEEKGSRKEKAVEFYRQALKLSHKIDYSNGKILAGLNLARILVDMGKINEAETVVESLEKFSKFENIFTVLIHAKNLKALIFSLRGNYTQALTLVSQAKRNARKYDLPALENRSDEVFEFINVMQQAAGPFSLAVDTEQKRIQRTQEVTIDFFHSYLQEIS